MPCSFYPIGEEGKCWGDAEKAEWKAKVDVNKRSYQEEVLVKIEALKTDFDVEQYGSLPQDPARYPLFCIRTRDWDAAKPSVLVTGGVHGYETSGVQGALLFAFTEMKKYSATFNILVCPCVSPWGYECIQRWNINAFDPNRSFYPTTADCNTEEGMQVAALVRSMQAAGKVDKWAMHIDMHETTDTDDTEFRPAKAARDGGIPATSEIPDGFYLVGNTEKPQKEWNKAMIDAVRKVTHIAPSDSDGNLIGEPAQQEGVTLIPIRTLFLCASVTNTDYAVTTEVYPDSVKNPVSAEQCNRAQVACATSGLDYIIANVL